jgi:hypothetical protein
MEGPELKILFLVWPLPSYFFYLFFSGVWPHQAPHSQPSLGSGSTSDPEGLDSPLVIHFWENGPSPMCWSKSVSEWCPQPRLGRGPRANQAGFRSNARGDTRHFEPLLSGEICEHLFELLVREPAQFQSQVG